MDSTVKKQNKVSIPCSKKHPPQEGVFVLGNVLYTKVNTMNETVETTPQEREVNKKKEAHADTRALETLLGNFRNIEKHPHEADKQSLVPHLFRTEKVRNLLATCGVVETDSLVSIIHKVEDALVTREREKNIVHPIEEAPPVANDNEAVQQQQMSIQENINELYRINNEELDQENRISQALAELAIFASDLNPQEQVQVQRSEGGEVEVLFEEDVKEVELLKAAMRDIRGASERIAVYDTELAEEEDKVRGGFFKKLFPPKSEEDESLSPRQLELAGKKARTEEELALKILENESRKERVRMRLQEKQRALELPLAVSAIDTFAGSWGELLKTIQEKVQKTQESLEANYHDRQKQIQILEQQRSSVADSQQQVA